MVNRHQVDGAHRKRQNSYLAGVERCLMVYPVAAGCCLRRELLCQLLTSLHRENKP
jgi:hypothetical protein